MTNDPSGFHGGVKTAAELTAKSTYAGSVASGGGGWLFNDSSPAPGPWYWDSRGFPKLNIGAENYPFSFAVITITTQPQGMTFTVGGVSGSLNVSANIIPSGGTPGFQWYSNTANSNTGGSAIGGATGSSYTLPATLTVGTHYYYCAVSATSADTVSSDVATVTVNKESPSLNLTANPSGGLTLPGSVTLTAELSGAYQDNSGRTVAFTMNGSPAGSSATNNSGTATLAVNPGAGTYSFGASFAGDANNNEAAAASITNYTVSRGTQAELAIAGGDITKAYGDPDFQLTTTGGSGAGELSWSSSNTAAATINAASGVVHIVGVGQTTISVTKEADANYNSITSAAITITVNKAAQAELAIAGGNITKTYGDPDFQLATTGGSGTGGLSWSSSNTAAATINAASGIVHIMGVGQTTISVTKEADANYNAAAAQIILAVDVPLITIETQPAPVTTVMEGNISGSLTIEASVSPSGTPSYEWFSIPINAPAPGNSGGVTTGVTGASFSIPATLTAGTYYYYCVVSAMFADSVTSNTAAVIVENPALEETDPTYPSNKEEVAEKTGIDPDDLEVKDKKVYLKKSAAEKIARELLGMNKVIVNVLPVYEGTVTQEGRVIAVKFTMSGIELLSLFPDGVNLIGMTSGSAAKLLEYVNSELDYGDGKFTVLYNGLIYEGELKRGENYELLVFIKDGGEFDLDGLVNGSVLASIFLAREGSGRSDGCNAGYGFGGIALMLALLVPLVISKKEK